MYAASATMNKDDFFLPHGKLNIRRLARFISLIEDNPEEAQADLAQVYCENHQALLLGITGPPGVGKSTLTDRLIAHYRSLDKKVAVIAVDASSPFTGGAILGDRIRMSSHATDAEVFIRSMGSRGNLGGLAPATMDVMNLLTSVGFDVVLIESVGVGQTEVDIMHLVDTVLLVLMPGLGDDVQALKAGMMEIADIFVINKADKPGAQQLQSEIAMLLSLRQERLAWTPPIVETVATEARGIEALTAAIAQHSEYLNSRHAEEKQRKRDHRFQRMVQQKILTLALHFLQDNQAYQQWAREASAAAVNPYAAMRDFENHIKLKWEV